MSKSPQSDAAANGPNAQENLYLLAAKYERELNQWREIAEKLEYCVGCGCGGDYGLCNACSAASNEFNKLKK